MQHSVAHSKCCKDEQMRDSFSWSSAPGTDALEYYSQVQDAAERRIDSAESIYKELNSFFRRGPMESESGNAAPTKKQAKKDFNAVLSGRKDGKVGAENISPKITGGKREVIDETFKSNTSFKDTIEGDIKE